MIDLSNNVVIYYDLTNDLNSQKKIEKKTIISFHFI